MLNPELPQRNPFVGPPAAVAVDLPTDIVERFADALHEWAHTEPTHTSRHDHEVRN